jgi:hypothetical protein
MQLYLEV